MSQQTPEITAIKADLELFLKKGVAEELDNRKLDETLLTQTKNALEKVREFEEKAALFTDEINALKAKNQELKVVAEKSERFDEVLHKALKAGADQINRIEGKKSSSETIQIETKAVGTMTTANNITGLAELPRGQYTSKIIEPQLRRMRMRDRIPTFTLEVGFGSLIIPIFEEKEGAMAYQTQGLSKSQIDYNTNTKTYNPQTIAGFVDVSRQMLRRIDWLSTFIQRHAIAKLLDFEDNALLNGAGGASAVEGIATIATPYVPNGLVTADSNHYDKLINARAQIIKSRFMPTAVLVDPIDAADMFIIKSSTGEYTYPGLSSTDGMRIFGMPIVETDIVTDLQFLMGDFMQSEIFVEEALTVRFSEESGDNFKKNLITIRVEESILLANYYANAYRNGTFTAAG